MRLRTNMLKTYLASPLGFSSELKSYKDKIKRRLGELGCTVLDPWEGPFRPAIEEASAIQDWTARVTAFKQIAAEIGFAAALGKTCYGLRTDFRSCGDFDGISINLQVLYWIESSGGRLFRRIGEITLP